jgi:multicomponent Na+:H+ antiporter subunit C
MGENFFTNYYEVTAILLFSIGFTALFFSRNLVKKIIGLSIAYTGTYLLLTARGYVTGRSAPIIVGGVQDVNAYVNPIPAGLILTGIVISVSVTAFALALVVDLYNRYETLDLDEIMKRVSREEAEAEG